MTLELFDGAHCTLRNGDKVVIRADPGSRYPWRADGRVPAMCWTKNGRYTISPGDHALDIVGVFDYTLKPDPDLFHHHPYEAAHKPKSDHKYVMRNGKEISGLLFFEDEIHTSQRDIVWTRVDGMCRALSPFELQNLRVANEINIERLCREHDIVEILVPKTPAELASSTEPRTVMMDETGRVYPDEPVPADRPPLAPEEERTEAAIQHVIDNRMPPMGNLTVKRAKELFGIAADAIDDMDPSVFVNTKLAQPYDPDANVFTKPQSPTAWGDWRNTHIPRKRLLKTLEAIAEGIGGTLGSWAWGDDPATIRFTVLFETYLRTGEPVGYEQQLTLRVEHDEGNATLPMKEG